MTIRELYDALQGGDLSVVSEVADVLGELADVIDMLKEANWLEQREAIEHVKQLDFCNYYSSEVKFPAESYHMWF
ncbi:hypothetical protein [Halomonas sp. hl-4]|uniref:hypothetical protein n=1 Tax=Halomonas sp. hl-4 TaxID=1761789 RepID=UPI000BB6F1F1|nr:hypothetical protein [Halomonas sp. hl-4]SNY98239.1 hypothetical protein SAMN04488142_2859 [Halomonas sp. hl-4]